MSKKFSIFRIIPDRIGVPIDDNKPELNNKNEWKVKLYEIMFENTARSSRIFDTILYLFILSNIGILFLESVADINTEYYVLFKILEVGYTLIFSIEYILRILCVKDKRKFIFSAYGLIDLFAILPTYLELFWPQMHMLMLIRAFRLLRIFRIFRMEKFLDESRILIFTLLKSSRKIVIFLFFVLILALCLGSMMFVLESDKNTGFSNIPRSVYWAIVTITTVGYGDITPITNAGKLLATFIMILGYAIIAVPSGILSASFVKNERERPTIKMTPVICIKCKKDNHDAYATFCSNCGNNLETQNEEQK